LFSRLQLANATCSVGYSLPTAMLGASSEEVVSAMSELMVMEAQFQMLPVEHETPRTPSEEPPPDPQQPAAKRPKKGQTAPWRGTPLHYAEAPGPAADPRPRASTLQKRMPAGNKPACSNPQGKPLAIQSPKAKSPIAKAPAGDTAVAVGDGSKDKAPMALLRKAPASNAIAAEQCHSTFPCV